MNVLIVHGQSHEGSTCQIARMLAEKLEATVTEFFLPRDFGAFCTGCTQCFRKGESLCPHYDQLTPLTEAMKQADVLILASPVYVYHVTGPMKAWLDHYGYQWMVHRPEASMFRKQGVCISTAAGGGTKSANRDLAHSLFYWGVPRIYRYGETVYATAWEQVSEKKRAAIDRRTSRLARKIQKGEGRAKPGLKTRAFFYLMRLMQRRGGLLESDRRYWQEKGWTERTRPWNGG